MCNIDINRSNNTDILLFVSVVRGREVEGSLIGPDGFGFKKEK